MMVSCIIPAKKHSYSATLQTYWPPASTTQKGKQQKYDEYCSTWSVSCQKHAQRTADHVHCRKYRQSGGKASSRSKDSCIPCLCCALVQLLQVPQQALPQQQQPQQPQRCLQLPAVLQGLLLPAPPLQPSAVLDAPVHNAIQIST